VVPWQDLKDLTVPAHQFMGRAGFNFFIFGGAVLAITTTINGTYMWATKSLMVLARDGLFPTSLAKTSSRGVPQRFLTLIWALSVLTLLSGQIPLQTFASYATIGGNVVFIPVMFSAMALRRKYPQAYEHSPFKLKGFLFWFCPLVGVALSLLSIVMLTVDLKQAAWPLLGWLGLGIIFYSWQLHRRARTQAQSFPAMIQADAEAMVQESLQSRSTPPAA